MQLLRVRKNRLQKFNLAGINILDDTRVDNNVAVVAIGRIEHICGIL